jgi:hypothetical protein
VKEILAIKTTSRYETRKEVKKYGIWKEETH